MINPKEHTVPEANDQRITDYLIGVFAELPTKSSIKKAIKADRVLLNNRQAKSADIPKTGSTITLLESKSAIKPYPIDLEIVHEDEHLIIVNKPPGLPTSGNFYRSLESALGHVRPLNGSNGQLHSPKPVHRLDSLTSGLIIAAKTINARLLLGKLFEAGDVRKTYHALVMGRTPEFGTMNFSVDGKSANTQFKRLTEVRSIKNDWLTLLELKPKTGRTHQLRIHCSESGYPIYGDPLYAKDTIRNKGLFLSAVRLQFVHPVTNKEVDVKISSPSKFENRMNNEQKRWIRKYGHN